MKIISQKTRKVHEIELRKGGENYLICPTCSADRKKSKQKSMSFNAGKGVGTCHHCSDNFFAHTDLKWR